MAALVPVCIGDAPYIEIRMGNQAQYNGMTVTATFTSQVTGAVVQVSTFPYQANTSIFVIYPGASVNAAGEPTDWPGWRFEESTQLWVPDPTDDYLREGLDVLAEVNPSATGQVEYPPATSACASPENPPPGTPTTTTSSVPVLVPTE